MSNETQKELYDKIANFIQQNGDKINEILSNSTVNSNILTEETQKKFEEALKVEISNVQENTASDEYYDPEVIDSIFRMLDSGKTSSANPKLIRSTSQRSISVSSLTTSENENQENMNGVMKQFKDIGSVLEGINNCEFENPDMTTFEARETEWRNKFYEFVFSLQRITKEINNIAATDHFKGEINPLPNALDDQLLKNLNDLSKVK